MKFEFTDIFKNLFHQTQDKTRKEQPLEIEFFESMKVAARDCTHLKEVCWKPCFVFTLLCEHQTATMPLFQVFQHKFNTG